MITNSDMYEGTRSANGNDVVRIEQLLRPLEEDGVLVHRSREQVNFITMTSLFHSLWKIAAFIKPVTHCGSIFFTCFCKCIYVVCNR
jgi:hypothetical protein